MQERDQTPNRFPLERWALLVFAVVMTMLILSVIWILSSLGIVRGPWDKILNTLFIVLGVVFTYLQWHAPLSIKRSGSTTPLLSNFIKGNQDPEAEKPLLSRSNVPPQNQFFTGRNDVLKTLHEALTKSEGRVLIQAITGLGGIGKTQIVIEYAHRYRDEYQAVVWAKADSYETLTSDFITIANLLKLPEKSEQDQKIVVDAVKHWLQDHEGWLLILDNVEDMEIVKEFIPFEGKGHILLTTRIQATGSIAQRIEIEKMPPEEGALLLLRRSKKITSATLADHNIARKISQAMGGLPLALDQAGAYIEETACSLMDYLSLYQSRRAELLGQRGELAYNYPQPVATTWSLSFERVEQANPGAAELLKLCAFLYPDAIPEEIITEGGAEFDFILQNVATDQYKLNEAIKVLRKFSLVHRDETKTLTVHRLVQAVLKDKMNKDIQREWAERTVKAVNQTFPNVESVSEQQCQRYLPHVQACAELIEQWDMAFIEAAELLYRAGNYLQEQVQDPQDLQTEPLSQERVRYSQAEPFLKKALTIYEQVLGTEDFHVAACLNSLGWLYYNQGEYTKAEPLCKQALLIRERILGPEHPDVAQSLNNLAILYYNEGKYIEAEPLCKQALLIRERVLAPEHPDVAQSLNDLAWLYFNQGKYAEAEPLYQQALAIREKTCGPDHPHVAQSLNAQAMLYRSLGKYELAQELFKRALAIREKRLGLDHPDVATSLSDLGWLYRSLGKYGDAQLLYQRVLAIREKTLGQKHPHLATTLNDIAVLYVDLGKYKDAEPLYQQALEIRERALGAKHPRVAATLNNMGWLYYNEGKYALAQTCHRRALDIRERTLPEHPLVAQSLNALAEVYRAQAKYTEAKPLYIRALAIREKTLGPEHRHVATSLNNLAKLYVDQGEYTEAEPLYNRALRIREKTLGPEHPNVAQTLNDLALLYLEQGEYKDAEPLYLRALKIREKFLGSEHPHVATNLNNLAKLYLNQGKYAKAEPLFQQALIIRKQTLEPGHPHIGQSLSNLGLLYLKQSKYAQAESLFQQALAIWEKTLESRHPYMNTTLENYAALLEKTNRKIKAAEPKTLVKLKPVLSQNPLGLVFDIDGTLSPIVRKPHEARLERGVVPLLEKASEYAHIAIITGRTIDDGARMVNIEGVTYIGTHGLEWSDGLPSTHSVEIVSEALAYIEPGNYLLDLAEKLLTGIQGIDIERKRIGGTIHYRNCSNPEEARQMIFSVLEEPAREVNMRLSEGKRVVEIKTPLAVDKGQALRRFAHRFQLQGVIFAGDDRTDLDAVLEIPRLRQDRLAALSIVVQHVDTLPELLEHGDIKVHEVAGMVELLREMVDFLQRA